MRIGLASVEGERSRENARRTLFEFSGSLEGVATLLAKGDPALEGAISGAVAYWGNGPTQPAGRAARSGMLLRPGDVFATVRFEAGRPVVTSLASVIAHVLVPDGEGRTVLAALPNDRQNRRWLGVEQFTNDLIFLERPLRLPPVQVDEINLHLAERYGPTGNRFPSRTIDVLAGHEAELLEALLGAGGALGWTDPRRPAIVDHDRTSQMQAEADAADLGDIGVTTEGAFREGHRQHRTGQRGVAAEGFLAYGRVCAACGDDRPWRIEFAHLIAYGRAATERWFVGIPLCGNHHADLDSRQLILDRDYNWRTASGVDAAKLGVTARTFTDFIESGLRPPKHVVDTYLTQVDSIGYAA